jgi:squalene cyclase
MTALADWVAGTSDEGLQVTEASTSTRLFVVYGDESEHSPLIEVFANWASASLQVAEAAPDVRQRWLRMAERARQRMATAPSYPDHPDDVAEQEAATEAFAEGQARSQSES